jgi:hypothetical protein
MVIIIDQADGRSRADCCSNIIINLGYRRSEILLRLIYCIINSSCGSSIASSTVGTSTFKVAVS